MSENITKKSRQWSLKVSADYKEWAERQARSSGLDRPALTLAGLYFLLMQDEQKRSEILKSYNDFIDAGCAIKNDLLTSDLIEKTISPEPKEVIRNIKK